jgi:ribonuclease Y
LARLEEIAMSFTGVNHAYALQAGREIRVIVDPERLDEARSIALADEIVRKIEAVAGYPGQIKVTVIREHRFVEYAK